MSQRELSIFIDESGDFGEYASHSPFYIVTMVLHDQSIDIGNKISSFLRHIGESEFGSHAIHAGPLIRREEPYKDSLMEKRQWLFNALFNFARQLDIHYDCIIIEKSECSDVIQLTTKLSKAIAAHLREREDYWREFDEIIVYYDNGQIELTKILTSVFNTMFSNVEFRKVKPRDYVLFQVADLICTLELTDHKFSHGVQSKWEEEFFHSWRTLKKNYMKSIEKKHLNKGSI